MAGKSQNVKRRAWVFIGLTGSLTATALLLQMLSPGPLAPTPAMGLYAQESDDTSRRITDITAAPAPWRFVYIHHSGKRSGDPDSLLAADGTPADHFVIGNGAGMGDGEIRPSQRWDKQQAAQAPKGLPTLARECISICLIGDYDRHGPTPAQLRQLARLVSRMQAEYRISASGVYMRQQPGEPAGIGRQFPVEELQRLLGR